MVQSVLSLLGQDLTNEKLMSTTSEKLQDLIDELEHIQYLFNNAESEVEVDDAIEELNNQAGTIHTIISEVTTS